MPFAKKPLPVSEQSVHEVLLAQPRSQMLAHDLSSLFAPRDDTERLKLTRGALRAFNPRTSGLPPCLDPQQIGMYVIIYTLNHR